MRKKVYWVLLILISLVSILTISNYIIYPKTEEIKTFELDDYSYYIDEFPSNKVLGEISSSSSAKEAAEKIWIETFGESVTKKKPYIVLFDDVNQVWLVQGSLKKSYVGGVPNILIRKTDGKVLAVWHDK